MAISCWSRYGEVLEGCNNSYEDHNRHGFDRTEVISFALYKTLVRVNSMSVIHDGVLELMSIRPIQNRLEHDCEAFR